MLSFLSRKKLPLPAIPDGHRIYAVGDIHGRLDLFDALLEGIRQDAADHPGCAPHIILLGDLIDRGPDSAGVVARAMAGIDFATMIALRGNHEHAMLQALGGDVPALWMWLRNGGDTALASWGVGEADIRTAGAEDLVAVALEKIPPAQLGWIAGLRLDAVLGDYYFVHAGVRPGVPLHKQSDEDRLWIREPFLASRKPHGAVVVHGHTIADEVEERANRIGIDTGAYLTGRLTALVLQGTERSFLQT